jgi:probable phosphoglycerate mutase
VTTPTTTFIVIRHGETLWNVQGRYQGHQDSPLTDIGREQADAAGRRLRGCKVDRLIASDLGRTRETAAIIAEHTGHQLSLDARLRERNFGILEGLTTTEIQSTHAEVFNRLEENDPEFVIPGGESLHQHYLRNSAFFAEALSANAGETIAIVAHGGVLDSIFRYVSGVPLDRPRCFVTSNASFSVFRHGIFYGTLRWVLASWGSIGHLETIGSRSDY